MVEEKKVPWLNVAAGAAGGYFIAPAVGYGDQQILFAALGAGIMYYMATKETTA